jgi:hypothetical protein
MFAPRVSRAADKKVATWANNEARQRSTTPRKGLAATTSPFPFVLQRSIGDPAFGWLLPKANSASLARTANSTPVPAPGVADPLFSELQRCFGNQAVLHALKQVRHRSQESRAMRDEGDYACARTNPHLQLRVDTRGVASPSDSLVTGQLARQTDRESGQTGCYDQRISQDLFEKKEVGQSPSGVNFEATAVDLPTDEEIMGKAGVHYFTYGFRWVQTVITNDPLPGEGPEFVDSPRPQVEPFYNKYARNEKGPGKFEDWPSRQLHDNDPIKWEAVLALVGVEPSQKWMEPYDVRKYGFTLHPDPKLTPSQLAPGGALQIGKVVPNHKVVPTPPVQDWSAFTKHWSIVHAAFPAWEYSPSKAKQGSARSPFIK